MVVVGLKGENMTCRELVVTGGAGSTGTTCCYVFPGLEKSFKKGPLGYFFMVDPGVIEVKVSYLAGVPLYLGMITPWLKAGYMLLGVIC